ncbi:hypothetical protein BDK51DRAFT_46404 [Blyttiomyces helicus]|uniref:Uncharacterized protein n=1 Tax=Blyttiomyces helicus TaxID=388810 RepID=A0A4P9WE07_9FUNG|nr:hypothetical protein BDK51DRAFT_46404 [Blyttiomyces helicus]|eukprot:RKO89478.1 hypothetical protein BDK51DRAFT_46404 [Blyttiomyces helicus]
MPDPKESPTSVNSDASPIRLLFARKSVAIQSVPTPDSPVPADVDGVLAFAQQTLDSEVCSSLEFWVWLASVARPIGREEGAPVVALKRRTRTPQTLLVWIPTRAIPPSDLPAFDQVAAHSYSDPTAQNTPPSLPPLSALPEAISLPLSEIRSLTLTNELTVSPSSGDAACLLRLSVALEFAGAALPDLWFSEEETAVEVERWLGAWFGKVGWAIVR